MRYDKILTTILLEIRPRTQPTKIVAKTLAQIRNLLRTSGISATPMLGGSYAKNTYLADDHDVDIFIRFSLKYRDEDISELVAKALRTLPLERLHGSRDYFHLKKDGLRYELVPVLAINNPLEARNITDYSPWHVTWVQKNGRKYTDDIRLAKRFCKANRCYGAESYIRGLSGHVLDILVIHYKGFIPLLRATNRWKQPVIIDHYNIHKGKAIKNLNKAKTQSPLILIDPVQPDRNAASALGEECFARFARAAKEFLRKPSPTWFFEKKIDTKALTKQENTILIRATPIDAKEDKAGAKLVQAYEKIRDALKEFGIKDCGWEWDGVGEAWLWYVLRRKQLPSTREQEGPPQKLKGHAEAFRAKYRTVKARGGRLYANVPRERRTPSQAIEAVQTYINERLTSWRI